MTQGLQEQRGVTGGRLVTRVWSETAAARAGLVAGDVITRAGSVNVRSGTDLREALATLEPGDNIEITYSRVTGTTGALRDPGDVESELFTTIVTVGAIPS